MGVSCPDQHRELVSFSVGTGYKDLMKLTSAHDLMLCS
jgi:hypothetical protein